MVYITKKLEKIHISIDIKTDTQLYYTHKMEKQQ